MAEQQPSGHDYAAIMKIVIDRARHIDRKQATSEKFSQEYEPNFIAIVEEVGEVAKALMEKGDARIRDELIDVLVSTMRLLRQWF